MCWYIEFNGWSGTVDCVQFGITKLGKLYSLPP